MCETKRISKQNGSKGIVLPEKRVGVLKVKRDAVVV